VTRAAKKPAEVAKHIDKEIDSRLSAAKVPASPRADDAEFLRRAYLDIGGKPPTAQQAVTFLDSADADKRAKLIDSLLASEDYGKHFGERWVNGQLPFPKVCLAWRESLGNGVCNCHRQKCCTGLCGQRLSGCCSGDNKAT
jgi:hypothetical protein